MKNLPTDKRILLFSGGMDSLIAAHLINVDIFLVISYESKYQTKELNCIKQLTSNEFIDKSKLVFDYSLNLSKIEREDFIIPARNLYFITVASHYGETIFLSSVCGDRSTDKDKSFFSLSEQMLNHIYQDQHWCQGRIFSVSAPFKDLTKTQLVEKFLTSGGDVRSLFISWSCYSKEENHCGWCKPCFRKWVALENNNVFFPMGYFVNDPWQAPWIDDELIFLMQQGLFRGLEDKDVLSALKRKKII